MTTVEIAVATKRITVDAIASDTQSEPVPMPTTGGSHIQIDTPTLTSEKGQVRTVGELKNATRAVA